MIARLYRSLRSHGLPATLRSAHRRLAIAASSLADRHFDAAFGTDTHAVVENVDLSDVASQNLARGIRYEPTRAIPFRRLLHTADIPPAGTFVDLGCGKGRACLLAAIHGFSDVVGIDYSPGLCRIAERNLDTLRERTGRVFHASIRSMDAADYAFAPADTVIYLYNPFDAVVLAAVVARLERSLAAHPRRVWIIYHNPVWRGVIDERSAFTHAGDWSYGGCDFAVYRTDGVPVTR